MCIRRFQDKNKINSDEGENEKIKQFFKVFGLDYAYWKTLKRETASCSAGTLYSRVRLVYQHPLIEIDRVVWYSSKAAESKSQGEGSTGNLSACITRDKKVQCPFSRTPCCFWIRKD